MKITNWEQMSVGAYSELLEVCKLPEPEDVEIGIIALLCGVDEEEILRLKIDEYQVLRRQAQFIASFPPIRANCPKSVTLNGKKYTVTRDVRKMTAGAYIDFQTFSKSELEKVIVELLSCFLIPEGKEYGEYDTAVVHDDIRDYLPVVVAYEMAAFFLSRLTDLTKATLFFSERTMKKLLRKEKDEKMKAKMKETLNQVREIRSKISGVGLKA